jgi:hypothetical protein
MKLHYFVKRTGDGRFQAQESQASYGGEHDHPAEFETIEGGKGAQRVKTYATPEEAGRAAITAANEARGMGVSHWVITVNPLPPR